MRTAAFLLVVVAAALGAVVTAAVGAAPAFLSGCLVLTFAGIAGAAASAALNLNAPSDLTEPRELLGPSVEPIAADMPRHVFGKLWLAALGAVAVFGFVPLIALARRPGRRAATGWLPGTRAVNADNLPLTADSLALGGVETIFPENNLDAPDAAAMLIRLPADLIRGASDDVQGYVAYSKVCTHAGCPVAIYLEASHQLFCPCHQSRFDVLDGARRISGPAPRALPKLALGFDAQGHLIALGDFDAPVGPDDWGRALT